MALFMVESSRLGFFLNRLDAEGLQKVKSKMAEGVKRGAIVGAYAKVGGGSVFIVNAESHAALARRLREYRVGGFDVVPLLDHAQLIDAHLQHRADAAKAKAAKKGKK